MKKKIAMIILGICVLLAIITVSSSAYVVTEWEQAVITEFGKPVGEPVADPGLHFKVPFIQKATFFEKRILEWDGEASEILTLDKESIKVNSWARWRITEPLRFYTSLRTIDRGQGVLDEAIESAVKDVISTHGLMEVLRNSKRRLEYTTEELREIEEAKGVSIEVGRDALVEKIQERASMGLRQKYGMELIDVQIKQINYVPAVITNIYARMRSERLRIRDRYESEGKKRKEEIEGEVAREKARIESEGYRTAKEIKGQADAEALEIYAKAYGQDSEFYSFLKTLETYEKIFGEDTHLILSTDSEFFRYLKKYIEEEPAVRRDK